MYAKSNFLGLNLNRTNISTAQNFDSWWFWTPYRTNAIAYYHSVNGGNSFPAYQIFITGTPVSNVEYYNTDIGDISENSMPASIGIAATNALLQYIKNNLAGAATNIYQVGNNTPIWSGVTDAQGIARSTTGLPSLPYGNYIISVLDTGYIPNNVAFTVPSTPTVNIQLLPAVVCTVFNVSGSTTNNGEIFFNITWQNTSQATATFTPMIIDNGAVLDLNFGIITLIPGQTSTLQGSYGNRGTGVHTVCPLPVGMPCQAVTIAPIVCTHFSISTNMVLYIIWQNTSQATATFTPMIIDNDVTVDLHYGAITLTPGQTETVILGTNFGTGTHIVCPLPAGTMSCSIIRI